MSVRLGGHMTTNSDLTAALERARHALALLEAQAAGYTVRTIPVHLKIELEEKRREVADLAVRLGLPPTPPLNPDHLAAYREALRAQCARLETRPYQQRAELRGAPPGLTLLETYEPLRFDLYPSRATRPRPEQRRRPAAQDELLAEAQRELSRPAVDLPAILAEPGHVVLLGKAGSGKTTVLRLVTAVLAAADPALAAKRLALTADPLPVPVLIALREFEHACQTQPARYPRDVTGLLRFVDDQFRQRHPDCVPPAFVSDLIRAGRAWILLDALDEVADFDHRLAVRQAIEQLAGAFPGNRLVVTARVAAYEQANTRLDERFNLAYVRDLTRDQWAPLVGRLYAGLETDPHFAAKRTAKLLARLDGSPLLRELVKTPLLVWTATLIHYTDRELPEQRAELYAAYVEVLLGERLHEEEGAEAAQQLRDDRWPADDRRLYLTYAAFKTHAGAAAERDPAARRDSLVVVDETTLVQQILTPVMAENMMINLNTRPGQRQAEAEARKFVKVMAERSGLLHAHPEGYTFGDHLTLQEFLAALYLVKNLRDQERVAFLVDHVGQSWWREVVLLMAGSLLKEPRQAQRFLLQELGNLPGAGDAHVYGLAWAGRALLEIPETRVGWHAGARAELAQRLVQVLWQNPPATSVAARLEVGEVLGRLGDPRFSGPGGLPEFIPLPGGEFWMGSPEEEVARVVKETGEDWAKRELPRHRVAVDGFALAKYPTTNAMFARFIAADGYQNPAWWEAAKAAGYWEPGQGFRWGNQPRYGDDERFNGANQPVVGVSWYEAVAYGRWLTATLHDGQTYRLPTEAEWEYAARGAAGRRYAWGDEWVPGRANTKEMGLERTTPVGLFPDGATPEGLMDLTGNVWEWCSDWFDAGEYARRAGQGVRNPPGPPKEDYKVLRGGSWYNEAPVVRCAYRDDLRPDDYVYDNYGFRVARGSLS